MRFIIPFIFFGAILSACDTNFFTEKQPKGGEEVKEIPKEFQGVYFYADFANGVKIGSKNFISAGETPKSKDCVLLFNEEDFAGLYKKGNRLYWNKYDTLAEAYYVSVLEKPSGSQNLNYYVLGADPEIAQKIKQSDYSASSEKIVKKLNRAEKEKMENHYYDALIIDLKDKDFDEFVDEFYGKQKFILYKSIASMPDSIVQKHGKDLIELRMKTISEFDCSK